jgi:uncharacterized protein YeaO (DUF488 family)
VIVNIKRIYEPFSEADGYRVLVDRLWPRGIKKEEAHMDKWMKDIAPSAALRKWIHHEPDKWEQFIRKYHTELNGSAVLEELLSDISEHKIVTLLFAAKDKDHNHALVLQQFIKSHSA